MRRTRKRRASTSGVVSRGSATTSCIGANRDLPGMVDAQVSHPAPSAKAPVPPIVLKEVYEQRFDETDQAAKEAIWRELGRYLQRYIVPDARVVDIACDLGYFIRNVKAADRWAAARRRGCVTKKGTRVLCPYTHRGRLPCPRVFVRPFLSSPPLWWLMGRQTLYLGEKPA